MTKKLDKLGGNLLSVFTSCQNTLLISGNNENVACSLILPVVLSSRA